MDDLKGSGDDLMKLYKKTAEKNQIDLRTELKNQLTAKRGGKKCGMLQRLDS